MEVSKKALCELAERLQAVKVNANTYTFGNEMNGKNYTDIAYSTNPLGVVARLVYVKDESKFYYFKEGK